MVKKESIIENKGISQDEEGSSIARKIIDSINSAASYSSSENQENENIQDQTPLQEEITWLIFETGNKTENEKLAVESKYVKELLRNNEIFPLPFVPSYVKGVLNCYGDPYAVVDLGHFFGQDFTESKLFIILHDKNHLCLQVNEIHAFHNTSEDEIQKLQKIDGSGEASFLKGAIPWNGTSVPVVDLETLIQRIRSELGNC